MVCIDFSNDWFSFFPNKILGKILFSKEKVCNFLAKFLQNAFCISLSLFFFFHCTGLFCKTWASHCSMWASLAVEYGLWSTWAQ